MSNKTKLKALPLRLDGNEWFYLINDPRNNNNCVAAVGQWNGLQRVGYCVDGHTVANYNYDQYSVNELLDFTKEAFCTIED